MRYLFFKKYVTEHLGSSDTALILNFSFYIINMTSLLFANCYMGQRLADEVRYLLTNNMNKIHLL